MISHIVEVKYDYYSRIGRGDMRSMSKEASIRIEPLGDRALIANVGAGALAPIEGAGRLEAAGLPWLTDALPAYDSVTVVYDPVRLADWMRRGGFVRLLRAQSAHGAGLAPDDGARRSEPDARPGAWAGAPRGGA